ncbi:MAG TPA: response regulator transcription factor [Flavobacteriales bacterium]|nr:response regulator transcription factor [Flavobacteriales bacterium]HIN39341.1 response regulator transcription factor [Flavobacteriales bacterium]
MSLKCLAIDDEPLALDIIEEYVNKVPFLNLAGKFTDPVEATSELQKGGIDLVFLDIQMPGLTGLEFLNTLERKPAVIFTTAYDEYAVESYDFNTIDYLLKPISFERFLKAANKANEVLSSEGDGADTKFIFIKADYKIHKIATDDIAYVEGYKDYVRIYTAEKRYVTRESMKNMVNVLPNDRFLRIHRSYIISIDKFSAIEGNMITLGDEKLPIGKSYKDQVMKYFNL